MGLKEGKGEVLTAGVQQGLAGDAANRPHVPFIVEFLEIESVLLAYILCGSTHMHARKLICAQQRLRIAVELYCLSQ